MEVLIYSLVFLFFALVIGFQIWSIRASSIAHVKQPLPARILRAVNLTLTFAALAIVIYGLVVK